MRRYSSPNFWRLEEVIDHSRFKLIEGEITDPSSIQNIIRNEKPDEVYNLAAQSHVGTSFEQPTYTFNVNCGGVLNILEGIRLYSPSTKLYQASTSEMFGSNTSSIHPDRQPYQDEKTPFGPNSPYGIAKLAAHQMVDVYRKSYNIFACSAVLHNHESKRRGDNFLTKKVTNWLRENVEYRGEYYANPGHHVFSSAKKLKLGNLDAVRDFGHSKDYVRAMWMMMQAEKPVDYVVATGVGTSIREFVQKAFAYYGLNYLDHIEICPSLYRPCEVPFLRGKSTKIQEELGWKPEYNLDMIIEDMLNG